MYVSNRAGTTAVSISPVGTASARRAVERGTGATSAPRDGATPNVSGPARLMSQLSRLRDSNPAQLSQVVSSLASGLRDAAAQDSGIGAKMLTALASKLDDIARGGDISQLAPDDALGSLEPPQRERGALAGLAEQPQPGAGPGRQETEHGSTPRASATAAYRAHAEAPSASVDTRRAALSQMLDELDAALKATGSPEPSARTGLAGGESFT